MQTRPITMDFIHELISYFYWYFRPIIKGFLRLTTRLCELQRICYGEPKGGPRTCGVENSMILSRDPDIVKVIKSLDEQISVGAFKSTQTEKEVLVNAVNTILVTKRIKRDLHRQFEVSLRHCLRQIWGYKQLVQEVEKLRSEGFDSENLEHERTLLQLWALLQPGIPLTTRKTKQWQNIGFQGEDPKTDFRGMGTLGLENLIYFAREYNSTAKHILSHSHHPKHGYSFAIVGINLTHMAYRLLNEGCAKSHMFNVTDAKATLDHFHHLYSYLFVEFDKFWLSEKPRDIMEFNRIRDLFENNVRTLLAEPTTCLKIHIAVENV
ncbi:hypothetical protein TCAL_15704 [Tigriopus californicus]|uniref:ELMO domain-containing protein n=1 Tax=Tigriopus californicus TaxID=6832 RepID=A0A553P8C2_TIGCA|nr:ELMO domain-containing protein 2-like isoform X2 [Tigriopus californicus]TRY73945.1 hypothetical protein TCAL_15704 [Tigriopus californicus]|eukprot:TCALIF_12529-PB protein Name:"Similar to Elmod2 ELMO domain-containing protein 2 (Mus musculus)" AED:0.03 eAED:0.03 QI:816/1/1/1/0.8/0.83/6/588/322